MDQATEGESGSKEDKNQDKKHTKKHKLIVFQKFIRQRSKEIRR